jgi:electron transfer flavoprotein beta subunit
MDIIVCIKRVPETAEADLVIDASGKGIDTDGLVFSINEWDNYAVEAAIQLKEAVGGSITVISVGPEENNEVLRRALAMGADEAIRLTDSAFENSDAYAMAKILAAAIKDLPHDLILTGVQADDDGFGAVGVALAQMLNLPYASLITDIKMEGDTLTVHRELEGGLEEVDQVKLPTLLTIQTGINEPRYVSIMGIRRVAKKEIGAKGLSDLGLAEDEVGLKGSLSRIEELFFPPVGEGAEIIEGTMDEKAETLVKILKERGGIA